MSDVAIVNVAAAGGRAAKKAAPYLRELRNLRIVETSHAGHATSIAATIEADRIIAVGGDGTLFEVVNGLMRREGPKPALGILPVGTGNSFVRDLDLVDPARALAAIRADKRRAVDILRVEHDLGVAYSINLVSIGFTAEVGAIRNRRFEPLGAAGYVAAVVVAVSRLSPPIFPITLDGGTRDARPAVLLSFSNSRCTGGQMRMAPAADPTDGLVDVIRVGPMGRRRLLTAFPRIYLGTHVDMPEVEATRARVVDFDVAGPLDLMIDGEILRARPKRLTVMHGAIQVLA